MTGNLKFARQGCRTAAVVLALGLPATYGDLVPGGLLPPALMSQAHAQTARERIVREPPAARIERAVRPLLFVPEARPPQPSPQGEVEFDLSIRMTKGSIYDPATKREDKVLLRSYRDVNEVEIPAVPFVAPTINVSPGMTVRVTLRNNLEGDNPECPSPDGPNTPHCFNSTNLHTHGLWISPSGNSDNVLLKIEPGITFQYEYNIPPDHPAGTFWYHPHLHGSTALQVSSGMGGALIIEGDRTPTPDRHGDIDTLLAGLVETGSLEDRLLLFQQIQYACFDANGDIKQTPSGRYICDPGDVGEIKTYDQFGPGTWPDSGRYTSINGLVQPTFANARAGAPERWRLVHAGVRDTIRVQVRKMREGVDSPETTNDVAEDWIDANCVGDLLPQFTIANDGLTRSAIAELPTTVLQPGYRADLLMLFPEAGDYCVIDAQAPAEANTNQTLRGRRLLGTVEVTGGEPVSGDLETRLRDMLMAAAERTMPADVRDDVIADLRDGLSLQNFTPHRPIAQSEISNTRELEMRVVTGGPKTLFEIDGRPYDPDRIDQYLPLGAAEEWNLTSGTNPPAGHPFHIHVNPFEIIEILNEAGEDVSENGEADDSQYAAMKGVWKDTIFVKPGYHVIIRSRYQRYIGEFVLHCHILDHEDQGMMQNVMIGIPDGTGGIAMGHH